VDYNASGGPKLSIMYAGHGASYCTCQTDEAKTCYCVFKCDNGSWKRNVETVGATDEVTREIKKPSSITDRSLSVRDIIWPPASVLMPPCAETLRRGMCQLTTRHSDDENFEAFLYGSDEDDPLVQCRYLAYKQGMLLLSSIGEHFTNLKSQKVPVMPPACTLLFPGPLRSTIEISVGVSSSSTSSKSRK
jgi:hypothetical protein